MPKKRPAAGPDKVDKNQFTNLQSPELAPYWLTALIESADDAIISKTLEGIITSWNAGAERIFGYTADEVIGKPVTILIPKGHEDEEPAILARLRAGERIEHYETIRIRKDGKPINISLTVSPIKGPNGKIIGASKIARDISEQRHARRALDEASERLKLASTAARLGDWSWDAKTDAVTLSETAAEILGFPPATHVTRTQMREMLNDEDRKATQHVVEKALAEHTDYDLEYRIRRSDNSEAWVSSKGRGLYEEDGSVIGMLGLVQDISLRKSNEETLREQAEALRTLNEVGKTISAELDLHNTVQAVTDAATELTGARFGSFFYNVVDESGASYMLYTLSGIPIEHFKNFPMPRATEIFGPTFRGEGVIRLADVRRDPRYGKNSPYHGIPPGHLPVVSYLAVPVVLRSGEVVGGLFFGHPEPNVFTERAERIVVGLAPHAAIAIENARLYQQAQRAIVERDELLAREQTARADSEAANRIKDEFLATVSHELRTPLNAIIGWSRMLRTGQLDDETRNLALETIERNVRLQTQIVEDILDVSHIITGKLQLKPHPLELAPVIEAAVAALRPAADAKGIEITLTLDDDAGIINGDADRLRQVVWNLLSNAVKFTPAGGRVHIRLERDGQSARIIVSDTGEGMSRDFLPFAFDRFRQADSTSTRVHGGLGLGLAIVRHIVEMHGGTVSAESQGEGSGATFTVALPLLHPPGDAPASGVPSGDSQ